MRLNCFLVAALALWRLALALETEPKMAEKKLIRQLLKDYDKKSRPVIDGETPAISRRTTNRANSSRIPIQQITVQFGLRLVQILDLNEMDQVLTTSMISLYKWQDYHLQWIPEEEDGIEFVHIPTNRIWLPDIALYNYADERLEEKRDCAAKVYSSGIVLWQPMAIYKSACEIKIKYFPFDKQVCWMKFGPWTYDGWRVNISYYNNKTEFDLEDMVDSPEWKIMNNTAEYNEVVYPCCPEPFVDITFWVWMRRATKFYIFILILPCFLLSSLTLVLFWLPPETPAKMVLGMNIFVAFFLLMLLLEKQTPSASDTFPLIGQYYCLNMGIITLSTFLSVIVVNFHFRGDNRQEVPHWLKKLAIKHGSRLLLVNLSIKPEQRPAAPAGSSSGGVGSARKQQRHSRSEDVPLHPTGSSVHTGGWPPGYTAAMNNSPHAGHQQHQHQQHQQHHGSPAKEASLNQHHQQQQQQQEQQDRFASPESRRQRLLQHSPYQLPTVDDDLPGVSRGFQEFDEVLVQCVRRQQQRQLQQHFIGEEIFPGGVLDAATRRRINMLTKDVQDIVKALRYIQKLHENKERVNKIVQEWRSVALVLDRLFFLIYVVTIALSIIFFFPKSGNEFTPGVIPKPHA